MTAKVTKLVLAKGFGFLKIPGDRDLFFHCSELAPSIPFDEGLLGCSLEFEVAEGFGKTRAVNLRLSA